MGYYCDVVDVGWFDCVVKNDIFRYCGTVCGYINNYCNCFGYRESMSAT